MGRKALFVNVGVWLVSLILVFTGMSLPYPYLIDLGFYRFSITSFMRGMIFDMGFLSVFAIAPLITLVTAIEQYDLLLADRASPVTVLVKEEKASWFRGVKIMTWVRLESRNEVQQGWFLTQFRVEESTSRIPAKEKRTATGIVFRYAGQKREI